MLFEFHHFQFGKDVFRFLFSNHQLPFQFGVPPSCLFPWLKVPLRRFSSAQIAWVPSWGNLTAARFVESIIQPISALTQPMNRCRPERTVAFPTYLGGCSSLGGYRTDRLLNFPLYCPTDDLGTGCCHLDLFEVLRFHWLFAVLQYIPYKMNEQTNKQTRKQASQQANKQTKKQTNEDKCPHIQSSFHSPSRQTCCSICAAAYYIYYRIICRVYVYLWCTYMNHNILYWYTACPLNYFCFPTVWPAIISFCPPHLSSSYILHIKLLKNDFACHRRYQSRALVLKKSMAASMLVHLAW